MDVPGPTSFDDDPAIGRVLLTEEQIATRIAEREFRLPLRWAEGRSRDTVENGLLTVPLGDVPAGGFPAIVFVHGYIPPEIYRTTERYVDYVDALARSGFVVFKIDRQKIWLFEIHGFQG